MTLEYKNIRIHSCDPSGTFDAGVSLYHEAIFPESKGLDCVRSYRIGLYLSSEFDISKASFLDRLNHHHPDRDRNEMFSFVVTTNLTKYLKTRSHSKNFWFEAWDEKYFDFIQILKDFEPELLEFFTQRQIRKTQELVKNAQFSKNPDEYGGITEIIEVDEFTSFSGNFKYDSKSYAKVSIRKGPRKELKFCYKVPKIVRPLDLPRLGNDCKITDLSHKEQEKYILKYLRSQISFIEEGEYAPIILRLFGNDDSSWSKLLYSEEELEKELQFLRKMQPISLQYDIINRDWFFSN